MRLYLRHKPYRDIDRKALVDIAKFCKQNFNINIFEKSFAKRVIVLDYYTKALSSDELYTLDVMYNTMFDASLYLIYSNVSELITCCPVDELWEFTSDGKNPNIWLQHPKIGTIAWNCRTGCTLIRPASTGDTSGGTNG